MLRAVRRVVTGHDAAGRAVIVSDGPAANVIENPARPGRGLTELWLTGTTPADNSGEADTAAASVALEPPAGGTVFRFFQLMPEGEDGALDAAQREAQFAAGFANMKASHTRVDTSRHPGMHKTASVDYIILLSGEVTMLLDEGEVELKPFDVVIQRGTNHAWINRGAAPAVLAAILIDAEPA